MLPVSSEPSSSESALLTSVLREVVETLAPIDRTPCSAGERQAAEWLASRMRAVAGVDVALEDEPSWGTFPPTLTFLGLLGSAAAAVVLARRRAGGALLALAALAGIVDEAQNGPRIARRMLRRRRGTVNLIATCGERSQNGSRFRQGQATLVVLAHHDAPQTGILFDQTLQRRVYELAPKVIERARTGLPQWWVGVAGPLCTIAAAARGRPRLARCGLLLGLFGAAIVADVWRSKTVPGANDNLSGVASLVALAELLRERPLPDLRVLLVSCGAEETLQDGVRAFIARHRADLTPASTCFVNLDTIGSPHPVMLEAEGPVWMESSAGRWLRDELAACAVHLQIPLRRGFRARASTDSIIPSRAGYPTATLISMTDWRAPANYHLLSDIPENLDYGTVADVTRLVYELARTLAASAAPRSPSRASAQPL
jgi:hypothetical protein